jgi:hypothetical protein
VLADSAGAFNGNLGGADIESAIKLERIAVDDFALKFRREAQRERAFSRSGGTENCKQESV